jgi:hypothetical protein
VVMSPFYGMSFPGHSDTPYTPTPLMARMAAMLDWHIQVRERGEETGIERRGRGLFVPTSANHTFIHPLNVSHSGIRPWASHATWFI